jgi:predicted metal-dependent hydrolase
MHHPQKYRNLPHPPGKELVNGESAPYLGRNYRVEVVKTGLSEIRFNQCFYIPAAHAGKRREVLREWYIQRAVAKIIPRVKHYARELGVTYSKVKIVDNLYRWGSCTVNNNVNFNWRLIKAPMFVIDYAIVHELAHLIEANHTPRFWNIIRAQAPTMEKAKAWLKKNGQLLEQAI